jgi:DNA-binding transcriptional ArsR family regulator
MADCNYSTGSHKSTEEIFGRLLNYKKGEGYMGEKMTTLSALSEPNRLHIVELLRDGPLTVGEIAERLGLHQPQVSKHLRVLSDSGLVEVYPSANRRIYKLRSQPFKELEAWMEPYRRMWDERFDNLDDYLRELQGMKKKHENKD